MRKHNSLPNIIHAIRQKLGIADAIIFIDDRGWTNKPNYDWMVAQFLIHNNISYDRDQKPLLIDAINNSEIDVIAYGIYDLDRKESILERII